MSRPSRARQDLRLDVLKKLDPVSEPKTSSCTSDSDSLTVLIDTILAPASQAEDFVGDWIYVRSQAAAVDSATNINEGGQFSATDVTLTVQDGTKFTVGDGIQFSATATAAGEICRITGISTHDLTLVRGIQSTTATTHEDADNVFIIGPAIGEIARVVNVDFSGTTSTLTLAPGFSASLVSGQEYERHRKVRPNIINDKLDVTLGLTRQNVLFPLSILTNGDMQDPSGADTNYTAIITATLSNETSATRVLHGKQSLKIDTGATGNSGALSDGVPVKPGDIVLCAADVYSPNLSNPKLALWAGATTAGATNEVETAESDGTGWIHFEFVATIPATYELAKLLLYSENANEDLFFSTAILLPVNQTIFVPPANMEFPFDPKEVFFYPKGADLTGSANDNASKVFEGSPEHFCHFRVEKDDTGVVPMRIILDKTPINRPLWIRARAPYPAFAGATDALKDVDTTVAHKDVVVNMTAASIIDDLALDATEAEKPQLSEQLQIKALLLRNEISGLVASMTPPKKKIITSPFTRD